VFHTECSASVNAFLQSHTDAILLQDIPISYVLIYLQYTETTRITREVLR